MTTYRLENEADRKLAMSRLTTIEVGKGWRCKITKSDKRRDSQNALLWRWNTAIAEQMHDSKEGVHDENKLRFGTVILCRDNDDFSEAWGMISANMNYVEQLNAVRFIDVTSIMSIKQMTEYLGDLELHYERNGILLPKFEDEYWEALGFSRRAA